MKKPTPEQVKKTVDFLKKSAKITLALVALIESFIESFKNK